MSRLKAACIHLSISLALALCVAALVYFFWFPKPYFGVAGAPTLMMLIMGVDIVIGPTLTLLVFNPGKPKRLLRLDLTVIGTLQIVAFVYGLYVICQARPVFIAAVVDRLNVVAADQISDADLAKGRSLVFQRRSWKGPELVGAIPPKKGNAVDLALQALAGGKDIQQLPQYYVTYEQAAVGLLKHAHPLSALRAVTPSQRAYLQRLVRSATARGDKLVYVPIQSRKKDGAAILSTQTKKPIAVVLTNPW